MIKMKIITLVVSLLLAPSFVSASLINVDFSWTGDSGYTMDGSMIYEEGMETVSYSGGSGSGVQDMTVSFYNPSNVLLNTFSQITANVVQYTSYLTFSYDTSSQSFSDSFDFGRDDNVAGNYYFSGAVGGGAYLYDAGTGSILDSSVTTVIPEPSSVALVSGISALIFFFRRRFLG